jgi:hypothetical protein
MSTYIDDAEREDDDELRSFFEGIKSNNEEAARQGKEMLVERLRKEPE